MIIYITWQWIIYLRIVLRQGLPLHCNHHFGQFSIVLCVSLIQPRRISSLNCIETYYKFMKLIRLGRLHASCFTDQESFQCAENVRFNPFQNPNPILPSPQRAGVKQANTPNSLFASTLAWLPSQVALLGILTPRIQSSMRIFRDDDKYTADHQHEPLISSKETLITSIKYSTCYRV